jgi:hypothetical protein
LRMKFLLSSSSENVDDRLESILSVGFSRD